MKVIVIRQPWAWLIVNGYKDIENRSWATHYRGPLLIQAAARRPAPEDIAYARRRRVKLPEEFDLGGVVGFVQLEDCVLKSRSKWFEGPVGWVLARPKKLPFVPLKGQLGLFDVPERVMTRIGLKDSGPPSLPVKFTIHNARNQMSPRVLATHIRKLTPHPPVTTAFQIALNKQGGWNLEKTWYKSQKEHWLGWLSEYGGPGFYGRKEWRRSAEFAYKHIVCPPMVLWLGEAAGIPRTQVEKAKQAALAAGPSLSAKSAAIRRLVSWPEIDSLLRSM